MGNSKLEILILTNPNTFSKLKCETWVMNLLYGGIKKIPTNVIINFGFWHSQKSIDSIFSKEDIVSIIESTSSKYNVDIKFELHNPLDGYSSGIQFTIIDEFINQMEDTSELMFISDNFYCVNRDILSTIYTEYKTSKIPFYTQIPIVDSNPNFFDSDMHLFCYHKNGMKEIVNNIENELGLKLKQFSLNFSIDADKNLGNFIFSNFDKVSELSDKDYYKIPINEPGVLFSNIFWCYLYYTNQYNDNVKKLSSERKCTGGTDTLNGYNFFRKNYTSSTELSVKLLDNNYHLHNYILLFENLLHKIYKDAIGDNTIDSIDEYKKILNNKFEWYYE